MRARGRRHVLHIDGGSDRRHMPQAATHALLWHNPGRLRLESEPAYPPRAHLFLSFDHPLLMLNDPRSFRTVANPVSSGAGGNSIRNRTKGAPRRLNPPVFPARHSNALGSPARSQGTIHPILLALAGLVTIYFCHTIEYFPYGVIEAAGFPDP